MNPKRASRVGEIAASDPSAAKFFDLIGIDYAFQGKLSLRDACAEAKLDPAAVEEALARLPANRKFPDRLDQPLPKLIEELLKRNWPALRGALARAAVAACGSGMAPARTALAELSAHLRLHLEHEEQTLFPVIVHMDECWRTGRAPEVTFMRGVAAPLTALIAEHDVLESDVVALRKALNGVAHDSERRKRLGLAVAQLECELREHAHAENNILFPRAVALIDDVTADAPAGQR